MARKKIENRNIRKLSRVGNGKTYTITIPIEIIREFGWMKKQKLVVEMNKKNKTVEIKDWEG
jgi:bifunctional DNA-binding transcriptional regulator/antitoxin component of YhaV-PrlF toxin-antitoxin module